MKPLSLPFAGLLFSMAVAVPLHAQVDDIKQKSASKSSGGSGESSSSSGTSGAGSAFVAEVAIQSLNVFFYWQQQTLKKKEFNHNITSVEVLLQTALQPSTYYIVHPRLRANWGIFSTDYRMNYLIEDDIDGTKHIRTDDWQILQLNFITHKNITARIGGGILHENFSGGKTFGEGTVALQLLSNNQKVGGVMEYRWSEPRKEFNFNLQFLLFQSEHFHLYATTGAVFETYYETIHVWGLQGGLMFRIS